MAGTLIVDTLRNEAGTVNIPVTYLKRRLVQRYTRVFRGGLWNPGNTYYEVPGSWINITPLYDDSYIVYSFTCPVGHVWNAHSISHWIFWAAGAERARWSKSCDHIENNHIFKWEQQSWGAGQSGSMGMLTRQYNSGNHGVHFNGRRYIDGSDSSRGVNSFISVEEYVGSL